MTGPRELALYRAERIDPATNAERKVKRMTRTNATLEIPADDFAAANERLAKMALAPTPTESLTLEAAAPVSEAQRPALAEQCAGTPTDQKAQLEVHPEPEQNGRQKQTRLSVKHLRERLKQREAVLSNGIVDAKIIIEQQQEHIDEWTVRLDMVREFIFEIDRD